MKQMTIVGNLGYDAHLKDLNGTRLVEFSVAVTERYKKADGTQVENTDWINVLYHNLNIQPHLKKGMKVLVQGTFNVRTYQANDKQWRSAINLRATTIEFLSAKPQDGTNGTQVQTDQPPVTTQAGDQPSDDLPF